MNVFTSSTSPIVKWVFTEQPALGNHVQHCVFNETTQIEADNILLPIYDPGKVQLSNDNSAPHMHDLTVHDLL